MKFEVIVCETEYALTAWKQRKQKNNMCHAQLF